MTPRRWVLVALVAAAILLVAARAVAQLIVDYQWYAALGAEAVWRARVGATLALRLGTGFAAGLFVFANLYAVRHSVVLLVLPRQMGGIRFGEEVPGRYLMLGVLLLSALLGASLALSQDDWTTFELARSNIPFLEPDPYTNSDLGFFVYWLPFEQELYYWTLIAVMIVTALVVFLYALTPSLRWDRGRLYISGYVRRHLTVLCGVLLVVLAWNFRLDRFALLTDGNGPGGAFGWVDHHVLLPANVILSIATLGAALIVAWGGWTGQGRLAGIAILGVIFLALLGREVAPVIGARMSGDTSTEVRERPYQATRAGYTRRAFLSERVIRADSLASFPTLAEAARSVPVWDGPAIARALESTRRSEVDSAAIAWRDSPAGVVADVLERPPRAGSDTGRTTFGLSRILAVTADEHGGLVRLQPNGSEGDVQLFPAVVFPGARSFLVVSDSLGRVAGARLTPGASRFAHALGFQRLRWASGDLPPHATVVAHRDVQERLRLLCPFFTQGSVVNPVVLSDSLFWVVDLYSSSSRYPLSRPVHIVGDDRTYFQHAATAIVRASSGETYVVADSLPLLDQIATTWVRRFPGLFATWSDLPAGLRQLLPPAVDGVRAQMVAFSQYGTRINSEMPRHPPSLDGSDSALAGAEPIVLMPGSRVPALEIVLLDASDLVRGVFLGTGGADRATIWYELARPGPQWSSVYDALRAIDSSSSRTTARDALLARGPIRAVPVAGDFAFVQSAYLWRGQTPAGAASSSLVPGGGAPPSLSRVSVLYRDNVRSGSTLVQLVGILPTGTVPPSTPAAAADFRERVESLYARMRDAMKRGDWASFGQAFDSLGKLLSGTGRSP